MLVSCSSYRGEQLLLISTYNDNIREVNKKLQAAATEMSDISYHKHRGLIQSPENIYSWDGVQLNAVCGLPKYIRSGWGAVIASYCYVKRSGNE